ncbi:hypothetical protein LIER_01663 [Lithospermum erythrorhizon]|uniref:Uncharacterized protein n=1 Tax=Lithospermum erythrorhizon TaxID=34254 RepID=A0AAV3NRA3_LITER
MEFYTSSVRALQARHQLLNREAAIVDQAVWSTDVVGAHYSDLEDQSETSSIGAFVVLEAAASLWEDGFDSVDQHIRGGLRWCSVCSSICPHRLFYLPMQVLLRLVHHLLQDIVKGLVKAVFSKARHVRDARCGVVPPEVHDRLTAILTSLVELSSKLQHETEAIGSVIVRESVITGLEAEHAEHAEFVLKTTSFEKSLEKGKEI